MDDVLEVDHKVPRARGGSNMPHNRQLLHGHCHDVKTAQDRSRPMMPQAVFLKPSLRR